MAISGITSGAIGFFPCVLIAAHYILVGRRE